MNVHELKVEDPKRFDREYWKWVANTCDGYDWWDSVEESFKQDMENKGVEVERVYFSLAYSRGDYASFDGWVDVGQWLRDNHPEQIVLIQEFSDYGRLKVAGRRGSTRVDFDWYPGNTAPGGIFADLASEDWDALVDEAATAFDVEDEINDWLQDEANSLYRQRQYEYEYLTSEQQFTEWCDANEIEFDGETEE